MSTQGLENYNIIFAQTCKEKSGFCDVIYDDMKPGCAYMGIGDLLEIVKSKNSSSKYHMIGRSRFVCEDNILKIHPCKKELIIAGNILTAEHMTLVDISDDLLRRLQKDIKIFNKSDNI